MGNIDLGQAFSKAWAIYSKNIVTFVIGALLTVIIGLCSLFILFPVMMGGLFYMAKRAYEGQTPEIGDVFHGFSNFGALFVGGLISLLAAIVGAIACGVGVFVTSGIVVFLLPLIVDGAAVGEAWGKCWEGFKANWLGFIVVAFLSGAIMALGSAPMRFALGSLNFAFSILSLFTMPFTLCLVWASYKQAFAEPAMAYAVPIPPPPPPAPPPIG